MMWHLLRSLPNKLDLQAERLHYMLCVSNNLLIVRSIKHKENIKISWIQKWHHWISCFVQATVQDTPKYSIYSFKNTLVQVKIQRSVSSFSFIRHNEIFWKSCSIQSQKKTFYICCHWVSKAGEKWTACVNPMMSPTYCICSFSSL